MTLSFRSFCAKLCMSMLSLYIIGTFLAVAFYPGGNYLNNDTESYSFTDNILQDLGRNTAYNGTPQPARGWIYNGPQLLIGLSFALFLFTFPGIISRGKKRYAAFIGSVFGIFSAGCITGMALSSFDLFPDIYNSFYYLSIISLIPGTFFLGGAVIKEKEFKSSYGIAFLILTIIETVHLLILLFVNNESAGGWHTLVIIQKLAVYSRCFLLMYETIGALKQIQLIHTLKEADRKPK